MRVTKKTKKLRKMAKIWLFLSHRRWFMAPKLFSHQYLLAPMIWCDFYHFRISGSIVCRQILHSFTDVMKGASPFGSKNFKTHNFPALKHWLFILWNCHHNDHPVASSCNQDRIGHIVSSNDWAKAIRAKYWKKFRVNFSCPAVGLSMYNCGQGKGVKQTYWCFWPTCIWLIYESLKQS